MKAVLFLAGLWLVLTVAGAVGAAAGPMPLTLEAEELILDAAAGRYEAVGDVRVRFQGMTLTSDRLQWDADRGEAAAQGAIALSDPDGILRGEAVHLDLGSGLGSLQQGELFLPEGNFHLAGAQIAKVGADSYRVTDGSFTTCSGEIPSWKFTAKTLDVTMGGYARARHVTFYLRDVPVLYVPYLLYPVKTERESGLLLPRLGYSQRRGTEVSLAYYQVMARNQDATFFLDYLSDFGLGKGLEYRYVFGQDNRGTLKGYHLGGFADTDDRFALNWSHQGILPAGIKLGADIDYVDRRDYYRELGESADIYNQNSVESQLFASRSWDKTSLAAQFKYLKDLQQTNERTLQRLPELQLYSASRRVGATPLFFSLQGSSTYFWREEGLKGERLVLRPALALPLSLAGVSLLPEVGFRERLYWTSQEGPGFETTGSYDASIRLGTRLQRVYTPGGEQLDKIRHTVEPEVVYHYRPDDEAGIPQFDALDRPAFENRLDYALTNRWTARLISAEGDVSYRELLILRLSQSFDLRQARHQRQETTGLDPFSALRAELLAQPTAGTFVDVDLSYLPDSGQLTAATVEGGVDSSRGDRLALVYRYAQDDYEYLGGTLALALLKPVYLRYDPRLALDDGRSLEQKVDVEYRAACWSLFLTYRQRPDDREFLVSFALSGLDRVGKRGAMVREDF